MWQVSRTQWGTSRNLVRIRNNLSSFAARDLPLSASGSMPGRDLVMTPGHSRTCRPTPVACKQKQGCASPFLQDWQVIPPRFIWLLHFLSHRQKFKLFIFTTHTGTIPVTPFYNGSFRSQNSDIRLQTSCFLLTSIYQKTLILSTLIALLPYFQCRLMRNYELHNAGNSTITKFAMPVNNELWKS